VFLFSLPIMIFASTKVVDEEIENRTMLTLMSKPVSRWQVILGKYLGVLLLVLVTVVALGAVAGITGYLRYFDDKAIDYRVVVGDAKATQALNFENIKALMALLPSMALAFLQLATLGAISVAVSTRYGLAVNVTVVVLIYIGANIAGFAHGTQDLPAPLAFAAAGLSYVLPGLSVLDLNQRLVFGNYVLGNHDLYYEATPGIIPTYGDIWQYVGLAAVYSMFYIGAALSLGMALFRSRELT
jgi:ABC-type transport system involved in multi-copper enzyme maturation permease subunit